MPAIPSQQVFYAVGGCHGNVRRITSRLFRKYAGIQDRFCQILGIRRGRQHIERFDDLEPLVDLGLVADRDFVDDNRRNNTPKLVSTQLPPLPRQLLMCRDDQIARGDRNEVADERGFEIDRFHLTLLGNYHLAGRTSLASSVTSAIVAPPPSTNSTS